MPLLDKWKDDLLEHMKLYCGALCDDECRSENIANNPASITIDFDRLKSGEDMIGEVEYQCDECGNFFYRDLYR